MNFEVKVVKVDSVEKHPNADRLTIVRIGGYTCIANLKDDGTWRYQPGDWVVYVPADTVVPEATLMAIGFWNEEKRKGILAGTKGDRVKPMKLRDVFSEGILIPLVKNDPEDKAEFSVRLGDNIMDVCPGVDVADFFGLTKYEPPIPTSMSGEVYNAGGAGAVPVKYDIEAWEKYVDVLRDGEEIVITEKLHGTFTGIAVLPDFVHDEAFEILGRRSVIVYSKGLGGDGLAFKDVEKNVNNLYVRSFNSLKDVHKEFLDMAFSFIRKEAGTDKVMETRGLHLLGETFGQGVQDLHYGQKNPTFRVFDAYLGQYPMGRYANDDELTQIVDRLKIDRVPVLYRGPYSKEVVMSFRDGKDTISNSNVREDVVVRPVMERRDDLLGRVQLKFVSPDYKLRKGNVTENS